MQRLKDVVRAALLGLSPSDLQKTIVVSGSPRSGTTWLAEMLLALPQYRLLDEPLHLSSSLTREAGVDEWRTYVAPDADRPDLEAYLRRTLRAQVPGRYIFRSEQSRARKLLAQIQRKPLVVKFVRASRLLHWLISRLAVRGIVIILRHPCAVVASQLTYETSEWRDTKPPDPEALQRSFGGWIPDVLFAEFESVLASVRTTAEKLAATWCLDTYIPLCYETDSLPGFLTTYERLVASEQDELRRLFDWLGESSYDSALEGSAQPSHSAATDLSQDAQRQLSKWQRKLSADQVDGILRIVEDFDLGFYTDDLHPDYDSLMQFQRNEVNAATPPHEA